MNAYLGAMLALVAIQQMVSHAKLVRRQRETQKNLVVITKVVADLNHEVEMLRGQANAPDVSRPVAGVLPDRPWPGRFPGHG